MIRNQNEYRANHRDQKAIEIQASRSRSTEQVEKQAADHSADNA